MENLIILLILAVIVGSILVYLYKAKKRGEGCIGCPYAKKKNKKGKCDHRKKD